MATKDEITAGIRRVEQRLDALLPDILASLHRPLPEGTWDVHDAVCHIAADVPGFPRWQARVDAAALGQRITRPPGFNLDELNQQNIDARKGKAVNEVVQEIREGLQADLEAVSGLEATVLTRLIPNFRGEEVEASQMLFFTTVQHNHLHLDDIEGALKAAGASRLP